MTLALETWPFLVILYVFFKTIISVAGDVFCFDFIIFFGGGLKDQSVKGLDFPSIRIYVQF